ncbi:MAG: ABC transporter permease [Syntrophomonadaceae bacterium]|nr:ABC transporter permease [Syntrophomonadaceae bacterium]MDD3023380.1 ABC transporter permease [Syntrophomonadaceae bacterium]
MTLISKLFRRRLSYRLHMLTDLIRLNFDWWEALYILLPGLVLAGSWYWDLLRALPVWFLPGYLPIWTAVIVLAMVRGIPRTYLSRADLIHVFRNEEAFRRLFGYGQTLSILYKVLPVLLLLFLAFPFYNHLQDASASSWILVCCWVLIVKLAILVFNWRLHFILSKWFLRLIQTGEMLALWAAWSVWITPFIQAEGVNPNGLYISAAICLITAISLTGVLPVRNWERVISCEESYDMAIMQMFLGYGAQAEQIAGKSGQTRFWRGHLGVGFKKESAFSYFFLKYFLRNRSLLKIYGQIYLITLLLILASAPYSFKLCLVGGSLALNTLLTETVWKEHTGDLYLRMLPMRWEDLSNGINFIFKLLLLPYGILIWIGSLWGVNTWLECLAGTVLIMPAAWYLARYFSSKLAVLFNYERIGD